MTSPRSRIWQPSFPSHARTHSHLWCSSHWEALEVCVVSSEISTAHQSLRATLNLIRTQARLCPLTIACHVSLPSVCACAIQRPTPPQNNHRAACLFGAITIINELITGLHTFQIFFFFFLNQRRRMPGQRINTGMLR